MKRQVSGFDQFLIFCAITCMVLSAASWASGTKVDQGQPGNQGPWPVTGTVIVAGGDGGSDTVSSTPVQCRGTQVDGGTLHKNTVVGVAAVNTPSAQVASRLYITLCNSLQNTGSPFVKCRVDGTAPVMAATNPGDVMGIGDCLLYPSATSIVPQCISDTASTNVTSFECVPQP